MPPIGFRRSDRSRRTSAPGVTSGDPLGRSVRHDGRGRGAPRDFGAAAWRKPQIVRPRLSSPVFAFATMPWKYPPGVERKCSAGLAETIAMAIAACSRPMARHASPQRDFETPSSPRSQSAASTISGQAGVGVFR